MTLSCCCLVFALAAQLAVAQTPDAVRREIEALYAKALDATRQAKSMDDLDEIDRTFNAADWRSIIPDQPDRTWADIRKYGFEGQNAPFQSAGILIDTLRIKGDTAVFIGRLRTVNMKGNVGYIPLKETWKHTVIGWKRQIHQKFRPGETPKL